MSKSRRSGNFSAMTCYANVTTENRRWGHVFSERSNLKAKKQGKLIMKQSGKQHCLSKAEGRRALGRSHKTLNNIKKNFSPCKDNA